MKKILLPVMMIAIMALFVSCGNTGQQEKKADYQKEINEQKEDNTEYQKAVAFINQTMKQIKAAITCEELEIAIEVFDNWDYPEDITDMEEEKLDQLCDQIEELYDQKEDELCDDDWY